MEKDATRMTQPKTFNLRTFTFDLRTGYFMPADDYIDEFYGEGASFGGSLIWRSGGNRWDEHVIEFNYFSAESKITVMYPNLGTTNTMGDLEVIPMAYTWRYGFSDRRVQPFFGGSSLIYHVKEKVTYSEMDEIGNLIYSESFSDDSEHFGVGVHFGILVALKRSALSFQVQYVATLPLSIFERRIDLNGISLLTSYRF